MLLIPVYVFIVAINAGMLLWLVRLPVEQREASLFGVRVSPGTYNVQGRRLWHRYRFRLVAAFIIIEAARLAVTVGLALSSGLTIAAFAGPALASLLLLLTAAFVLHSVFYRQTIAFEEADQLTRTASSMKVRCLGDYTSTALEIACVVLTVAPIAALAGYYQVMPDKVIVHRSLTSVFGIPALIVCAQGWFWLTKFGFIQGQMALPVTRPEEFLRLKEEALRIGLGLLDWFRVLFAVPMVYVAVMYIGWTPDRFRAWAVASTVFGLSWGTIVLVVINRAMNRVAAINQRLKAEFGYIQLSRRADSGHWLAGRLLYHDPENPALFVETPVGPGYTLNLANRWSYIYVSYLSGLLLLCLVTVFIR